MTATSDHDATLDVMEKLKTPMGMPIPKQQSCDKLQNT
jgi:hypothetical protein